MKTIIVVGSTNRLETSATAKACAGLGIDAELYSVAVPQPVYATPFGFDQIKNHAQEKAAAAGRAMVSPLALAIGIQSGIIHEKAGQRWYLVDAVTVCDKAGNLLQGGWTELVLIPTKIWRKLQLRGTTTTTVGMIVAEQIGGKPEDDPYPFLGNGLLSHETLLEFTIRTALDRLVMSKVIQAKPRGTPIPQFVGDLWTRLSGRRSAAR
jgi:non-canonical (house-cleaning) NTP pyrophosphatase